MGKTYDFAGWATKANLRCSDGRVIMPDAFKECDGKTVPLVWNHRHDNPDNVLGHALLENRNDGVYAYCTFNDTESGRASKLIVQHGDVAALSICANQLKQHGSAVMHGIIREVSLVLAGANPGASIDFVMSHGEESEDEAIIYNGEPLDLEIEHSDDSKSEEKEEPKVAEENKDQEPKKSEDDKTVQDVVDSMTEEQKKVMYALIGMAAEDAGKEKESDEDENEGGEKVMKHNVFDQSEVVQSNVLTHADQMEIMELAKDNSVGTLRKAMSIYAKQHEDELQHGIEDIEYLFPEYKNLQPGAPELVERDQGWVNIVMSKAHKTPFSRIRTRQMDVRSTDLRGKGYQKKNQKKLSGDMTLIRRTTDPQTIYRKDALERDDIVDITDFDVAEYQYRVMRSNLNEEVATAIMIGDGRESGAEDKIYQEHVRSIWLDDELYTIHKDLDLTTAEAELQGTNTSANFGDNYIFAEAMVQASLYAREEYKGTGTPDFFCTPHYVNRMLLARDLNGRRIYDSVDDLAKALNVKAIYTAEQFADQTRTTSDSKTKELVGIFVNLADYNIGATKGGEITKHEQFDIDFNQEKYLIETRISGALTRIKSAIALELDVTSTSES